MARRVDVEKIAEVKEEATSEETELVPEEVHSDTSFDSEQEALIVDNLTDFERELYDGLTEYHAARLQRQEKIRPLKETIKATEKKTHPGVPASVAFKMVEALEQGTDETIIVKIVPSQDPTLKAAFGIKQEIKDDPDTKPVVSVFPETLGYESDEIDDEVIDLDENEMVNKPEVTEALELMEDATQKHLEALKLLKKAVPEMTDASLRSNLNQVPHLSTVPVAVEDVYTKYGSHAFRLMLAAGQVAYKAFMRNTEKG